MKVFTNFYVYLFIFSMVSCRETPNTESESVKNQSNEEVLLIESDSLDQLDKANKELDNQLNELDKAIKDLNNI